MSDDALTDDDVIALIGKVRRSVDALSRPAALSVAQTITIPVGWLPEDGRSHDVTVHCDGRRATIKVDGVVKFTGEDRRS